MARRRRKASRILQTIVLGAIIVVAAVWSGTWYAASLFAENLLSDGAAAVAAGQGGAMCEDRRIIGFPFSFEIGCGEALLVDEQTGVRTRLAGASASAPLYDPGHVVATAAGPLTVEGPAGTKLVDARWDVARAAVDLRPSGVQRSVGLVEDFRVGLGGAEDVPFRSLAIGRGFAELKPSETAPESLNITVSGAEIVLERGAGETLPALAVEADLDLLGIGEVVSTDTESQIDAWLRSGASIDVKRLTLGAGGASIGASGNLTVSTAGLVSGTVMLRLVGLDGLPEVAEAIDPGAGERVGRIVGMVTAMLPPTRTAEGAVQELTLTLANGAVWAGLIKLGSIPPLFGPQP